MDIDRDQTRVKTVDEANTRRRVVEGAEKGSKEKVVRENSQSPTMKEMRDKMVLDERHVSNIESDGSLNIRKAGTFNHLFKKSKTPPNLTFIRKKKNHYRKNDIIKINTFIIVLK